MATRAELAQMEEDLSRRLRETTPAQRARMGGTALALQAVQAVRRRQMGMPACEATRKRILTAARGNHLAHKQTLAIITIATFTLLLTGMGVAAWHLEWLLAGLSFVAALAVVGFARWLRI